MHAQKTEPNQTEKGGKTDQTKKRPWTDNNYSLGGMIMSGHSRTDLTFMEPSTVSSRSLGKLHVLKQGLQKYS